MLLSSPLLSPWQSMLKTLSWQKHACTTHLLSLSISLSVILYNNTVNSGVDDTAAVPDVSFRCLTASRLPDVVSSQIVASLPVPLSLPPRQPPPSKTTTYTNGKRTVSSGLVLRLWYFYRFPVYCPLCLHTSSLVVYGPRIIGLIDWSWWLQVYHGTGMRANRLCSFRRILFLTLRIGNIDWGSLVTVSKNHCHGHRQPSTLSGQLTDSKVPGSPYRHIHHLPYWLVLQVLHKKSPWQGVDQLTHSTTAPPAPPAPPPNT